MLLAFIRRLRSFEGYHDQLGADDVIPEEARNTSERACFGKVVLNGRHVIIAGPNRQARLRAGKDALDLLQQYKSRPTETKHTFLKQKTSEQKIPSQ